MGRYGPDYGRDFGGDFARHDYRGSPQGGGMRPEGWGGHFWRGYGPDEGWSGPRQDFRGSAYDQGFRNEPGYGSGFGAFQGGRGGYGDQMAGGYGTEYGGRGFGREIGYGGRSMTYPEGWQDQPGGMGQGTNGWGRARAAEIMTENPQVVTADTPIADVAQKMRDLDVGIIPVVESTDDRRLRGVITDRDITVRAVAEGKDGKTKVSDCMTDQVRAVNKNDSIQDVMWLMRREQIRRVPVTDREGRLVGIIAQADLAVDYASDDRGREMQLAETLERVSEPALPRSGGKRMAASGADDQKGRGR